MDLGANSANVKAAKQNNDRRGFGQTAYIVGTPAHGPTCPELIMLDWLWLRERLRMDKDSDRATASRPPPWCALRRCGPSSFRASVGDVRVACSPGEEPGRRSGVAPEKWRPDVPYHWGVRGGHPGVGQLDLVGDSGSSMQGVARGGIGSRNESSGGGNEPASLGGKVRAC